MAKAVRVFVEIRKRCCKKRRPHLLWANIGPFTEQETEALANPAVTLTDIQKYPVGPFNQLDKKGQVIGPATDIKGASGDENVLTVSDNGDGTFEVVAGLPGQAQATFTDAAGSSFVVDNTVTVSGEASISGAIGAPVDQ